LRDAETNNAQCPVATDEGETDECQRWSYMSNGIEELPSVLLTISVTFYEQL